jgi:transcriptional regulator with XRE-family HTH domain
MQIQESGNLSRFVREMMALRRMTIHEIKANATTEITESYISGIIKGSSCNPSVKKLVALASGLGVDPVELFKVAAGLEGEESSPSSFPAPDAVALIATMERIVSNDKLLDIMGEALLLRSGDRAAALGILRSLNEARLQQTKTAGSA